MADAGFYPEFLQTLFWRPGQALAALYWHLTGRRVRARNRLRIGAQQSPLAYSIWIDKTEALDRALVPLRESAGHWNLQPGYSVITDRATVSDGAALDRLIATLAEQQYPDWELLLPATDEPDPAAIDDPRVRRFTGSEDDVETLSHGIAAAAGDYVVPLRFGTQPSAALFHRITEALQTHPEAVLLYGDHDRIDDRGARKEPWFKPRWNRELFLAQDYVSQACAIQTKAARASLPLAAGSKAPLYALLLRLTTQDDAEIVHVPHILCHIGSNVPAEPHAARREVVAEHLAVLGATASLGPFDIVQVQWPLPATAPLVSIIVPTRDRMTLLRTCVSGVLDDTAYENIELIVVDNGSTDDTADVARSWADRLDLHVVTEPVKGTGAAADTGMRYAIGRGATHLARTDADCLPAPGWVAAARAGLDGGLRMVSGPLRPRTDEFRLKLWERRLLPAVVAVAATFGRFRPGNRDRAYVGPYVMMPGCNMAITAALYEAAGGFPRTRIEDVHEDRALVNRVRRITGDYGLRRDMVVHGSVRRLRAYGLAGTLAWYADHRYTPDLVDIR